MTLPRVVQISLITLILCAISIQVPTSARGNVGCVAQAQGALALNDTSSELLPVWHIDIVDQNGDVGAYASLTIDSNNQYHIAYYDATNADLKYAYQENWEWQLEVVAAEGFVGRDLSLALDGSDYPHIIYSTYGENDYGVLALNYTYKDANGWHFEEIERLTAPEIGSYTGGDTALALDRASEPQVAFQRGYAGPPKSSQWLQYAYRVAGEWMTQPIDGGGFGFNVGANTSIALDDAAHPHISYLYARYDFSPALRYVHFDGQTWHYRVVDGGGSNGRYSSLALNGLDYPSISYYVESSGDLRYAQWAGTTWVTETVQSDGDVGLDTSLVLDASSRPAISYRDDTNGHLSYTYWDGYRWQVETADNGTDVGYYSSLAIDSNDRIAVAYYDRANQDLKLAYRELVTPAAWIYLPIIVGNPFQ